MPRGNLVSHTMSSRGQLFQRNTDCVKAVAIISVEKYPFPALTNRVIDLHMMLPQTKILSLFTTQLYIR